MGDFHRSLQLEIEPHLLRIERILRGRYKLTLFARYTGNAPLNDADILMTVDDLDQAIAGIKRLAVREPTVKP